MQQEKGITRKQTPDTKRNKKKQQREGVEYLIQNIVDTEAVRKTTSKIIQLFLKNYKWIHPKNSIKVAQNQNLELTQL